MKPVSMEYEDGGVEGWVPRQGVVRGRIFIFKKIKNERILQIVFSKGEM